MRVKWQIADHMNKWHQFESESLHCWESKEHKGCKNFNELGISCPDSILQYTHIEQTVNFKQTTSSDTSEHQK